LILRRDRRHLLPGSNGNADADSEASAMRTAFLSHFDTTKQGKILRNDFIDLVTLLHPPIIHLGVNDLTMLCMICMIVEFICPQHVQTSS
jgi:hypothetical protein